MTKASKQYFEISPSWAGGTAIGPAFDGWYGSGVLTTGLSFADIERRYDKTISSSGQFKYKKWPNAIPDFVYATGCVAIVKAEFKSVIETMAPGEAEFRPFAMRWPDDDPVAGDWYLMNILNLVDCFDFERMGRPRPVPHTHRPLGRAMTEDEIWLQARLDQAIQVPPFYINPAAVGSLQIWRPFFHSHALYCTAELLKALKAAGIKRLHADRLGTRDDPLPVFNRATGLFEMPQLPEPRPQGS